jgi:general stress protein YciG
MEADATAEIIRYGGASIGDNLNHMPGLADERGQRG